MKRKRSEKDVASELEVVRLSDVVSGSVRFLVEPYLPLGSFCLLEGDPAAGKSYVAADLSAAVTRGRGPDLGWEPGERTSTGKPRNVLYLTAEDAPKTLKVRFVAQGADLDRVFCVPRAFSVRDLAPLERLLRRHDPALVVVDPVHALLGGVNMNAANSVRVALAPLAELAARCQFSVLAIRHLAKAGRGRGIYRGIGSIDFSAVARSVLRIGEDPERPGSRVLVHVKNSYGPLGPSLDFEIGERLVWLGRSELTSQDLDARPRKSRGRSALEIAADFLRGRLSEGPRAARETRDGAAQAGIALRTLERAARDLGVVHTRANGGGSRGQGRWIWSLPPDVGVLEERE